MYIKSICLFFTCFFLVASGLFSEKGELLEISKFVDGDTFWVRHSDGREEKIRLIGIDTPESRNTGRTKIEHFGKEAADYVKCFLSGKKVRLVADVQLYDRYKRTLAYVYLEDGTFLNAHLVSEGYATVATFPPNVKYADLFLQLEREARRNKKGLWASH
ncbi:thermonuclease family protein [Algoriphagus sp. H41]|uniref:Thermonuclease family protein n=1 Tax=Algoriphagus oliviformis TaxID=2811231 RepID=A0ABS3C4I7_9BACT|nr:thermonuclease family protein [Algoriphagus oliviformis]MBN7811514.1 thermonuclease family protein [Algoriphagus oliviformis]